MVNIGNRIKSARQKAGMSQEELAQIIGVTKSTISKYEKGAREPRYDQLQRMAKALDVSIYELFDGSTMDTDGTLHIWPAPQNASDAPTPELVEKEGSIQPTNEGVHGVTVEGLDELLELFDKQLKAAPKGLFATTVKKREEEREKREAFDAALKAQMQKIRQHYGPTAFPELDELEALLYKFQKDAIIRSEQERIKRLLASIRYRLIECNTMAPSPGHLPAQDTSKEQITTALEKDGLCSAEDGIWAYERAPIRKFGRAFGLDLGSSMADLTATPQRRISAAMDKLNEEGQEKAAERVEELTEIPRYQAQEPPQQAPKSSPAPDPPDAPETPPDAPALGTPAFCPICGRLLAPAYGSKEVYCYVCQRSFPLSLSPQKINSPKP